MQNLNGYPYGNTSQYGGYNYGNTTQYGAGTAYAGTGAPNNAGYNFNVSPVIDPDVGSLLDLTPYMNMSQQLGGQAAATLGTQAAGTAFNSNGDPMSFVQDCVDPVTAQVGQTFTKAYDNAYSQSSSGASYNPNAQLTYTGGSSDSSS